MEDDVFGLEAALYAYSEQCRGGVCSRSGPGRPRRCRICGVPLTFENEEPDEGVCRDCWVG